MCRLGFNFELILKSLFSSSVPDSGHPENREILQKNIKNCHKDPHKTRGRGNKRELLGSLRLVPSENPGMGYKSLQKEFSILLTSNGVRES